LVHFFTYNAAIWSTASELERRIDGVYTRPLLQVLDVSWQKHVTNEKKTVRQDPLCMEQLILRQRCLSCAGQA